jgi:hypothetical protein
MFNDAINCSNYVAENDGMSSQQWIQKRVEWKGRGLI